MASEDQTLRFETGLDAFQMAMDVRDLWIGSFKYVIGAEQGDEVFRVLAGAVGRLASGPVAEIRQVAARLSDDLLTAPVEIFEEFRRGFFDDLEWNGRDWSPIKVQLPVLRELESSPRLLEIRVGDDDRAAWTLGRCASELRWPEWMLLEAPPAGSVRWPENAAVLWREHVNNALSNLSQPLCELTVDSLHAGVDLQQINRAIQTLKDAVSASPGPARLGTIGQRLRNQNPHNDDFETSPQSVNDTASQQVAISENPDGSKNAAPSVPGLEWLTINVEERSLCFHGQRFEVSSVNTLLWLRVLAGHPNQWIAANALGETDHRLKKVADTAELKRKFVAKIVTKDGRRLIDYIESREGYGSRLTTKPLTSQD